MAHSLLKFGLFGSAIGSVAGLGIGAYYGGVLGAVAGATSGLVLGPLALLVTTVAVGLACVTAAAAVAVPCFLGYLLMRAVLGGALHLGQDTMECCFSNNR